MPQFVAQSLMDRETRVTYGQVPHTLLGTPLAEASWHMHGDRFLLRAGGEHYFYYRRGDGITVERGPKADVSEESLWLSGSVYAAIASMNGLVPIHASAVAFNGGVYAFAGAGGAGKSTMVAALGKRGLPMFCDDTLVLDPSDSECLIALPGHKRLKLRPDAVELTGAVRQEKVSRTYDKYYALPTAAAVLHAMPLAALIFLEEGPELAIRPLSGAERFVRMEDDHQTARLFEAARQFDRVKQFAHRARLARQIPMSQLIRPFDSQRFEESVALAMQYVTTGRT
jgi:hypothetical protein